MRRLYPCTGTLLWLCFDISLPTAPVPVFLPRAHFAPIHSCTWISSAIHVPMSMPCESHQELTEHRAISK